MQLSCILIFYMIFGLIYLIVVVETRSSLISHINPNDVKHFASTLDTKTGYWSPSTSSIDWCECNYVVTQYIAEFWNCISSFLLCISAGILIIRGLCNRIENRFLLFSLSFGLIGFGSACFHGTLTHFGQMIDELPMVYSMIVWWFILFRINTYELKTKRFFSDILVIFGIFYGFLWTYVHRLKTFVLLFQVHFVLMVLIGIIKLIYLYRETQHRTYYVKYLLMVYLSLLVPTSICWILDQQLCERMNSKDGFNPQLNAWWHVFLAIDFHLSAVCAEAMRFLSIKYQQYQIQKRGVSSKQLFKPTDHLHIVFHFGLPFVDYSKDKSMISY